LLEDETCNWNWDYVMSMRSPFLPAWPGFLFPFGRSSPRAAVAPKAEESTAAFTFAAPAPAVFAVDKGEKDTEAEHRSGPGVDRLESQI
jgi:hypothetical protein